MTLQGVGWTLWTVGHGPVEPVEVIILTHIIIANGAYSNRLKDCAAGVILEFLNPASSEPDGM